MTVRRPPLARRRSVARRPPFARPLVLGLVLAVALALVVAGCSDGDGDGDRDRVGARRNGTPSAGDSLPPDGTEAIAALYDERLKPLGWRVQRSGLEHRDEPKPVLPGKRHLAVYLRPLGEPTAKDYLDGLATVSKVFLPHVFDDYPGLQSFDVCLEPTEEADPSAYPKALTQVLVTRPQLAELDWRNADPADVVAGGIVRHPNTLVLLVAPELRNTAEWEQLLNDARSG